ncbi:hypothetical protein BX600DRAFT_531430 [Xylariales sp. PMI_506]|nr:hypothetical protein BX600DRAFT_531430 [Xylariales sp. PMI_506]
MSVTTRGRLPQVAPPSPPPPPPSAQRSPPDDDENDIIIFPDAAGANQPQQQQQQNKRPSSMWPQPLIADILRTRYCIPGSVFLVEGVDAALPTSRSRRWRAVRLLLGDGEFCVQALLAAEMHRYVDGGDVAVGAYVRLGTFRLESVVLAMRQQQQHQEEREQGTGAKGKGKEKEKAEQEESLVYLVVEDLVVVGWNKRITRMLEERGPEDAAAQYQYGSSEALNSDEGEQEEEEEKEEEEEESRGQESPAPLHRATASSQPAVVANPEAVKLLEEIADADDDFEVMETLAERMTQKRTEIATALTTATADGGGGGGGSSDYTTPVDPNHLPWSSTTDPSRPLRLTPLSSVPHLPFKQNWSVNVLAVVASLSAVEAAALPPGTQRTARLAHPSTPKRVHLTVFLDPAGFAPAVGSVVLLLGVKNHRFDGGCLKKYASDRPAPGAQWWHENPTQLEWCDVERLRRWWLHEKAGHRGDDDNACQVQREEQ